uniref:Mutator-like transposase domain-containing protein n=1 Tax=Magallana gigas TaxID=29159 RepID=K1P9C4_MAGGI
MEQLRKKGRFAFKKQIKRTEIVRQVGKFNKCTELSRRLHRRRYPLHARAVQHTGVGYTQINGILAELNIPPISKTLLYTRQEEVGQATESVASSSINDALQEELEATTKNKQSTSNTVSVDGAWQKRGSGRSYDSLTGTCEINF